MSPERTTAGRKKLVDTEMVTGFFERLTPYSFPGMGVEIDNTGLRPEETARRIVQLVEEQVIPN